MVQIPGEKGLHQIGNHPDVGDFVGEELDVTKVTWSLNPGPIVHFQVGDRAGQVNGKHIRRLDGQKPDEVHLSSAEELLRFLTGAV
ncbi:MAG: hypothetical protein WCT37_05700 [Patescibacteria group bacterium]|jgi:hypothetical protein